MYSFATWRTHFSQLLSDSINYVLWRVVVRECFWMFAYTICIKVPSDKSGVFLVCFSDRVWCEQISRSEEIGNRLLTVCVDGSDVSRSACLHTRAYPPRMWVCWRISTTFIAPRTDAFPWLVSHVAHVYRSHFASTHESRRTRSWVVSHLHMGRGTRIYCITDGRLSRNGESCCAHIYMSHVAHIYGVATVSRIDKIIGLSCRISSLLWGSFAKETYILIDPTHRSHPIVMSRMYTWVMSHK